MFIFNPCKDYSVSKTPEPYLFLTLFAIFIPNDRVKEIKNAFLINTRIGRYFLVDQKFSQLLHTSSVSA